MSLLPPSRYFPPAESANDQGMVCAGGQLDPDWLLDAYSHGIFPWPVFDEGEPIVWWSPDPRAIFQMDQFHIPRRLQRTCYQGRFALTCNIQFEQVIHGCASAQDRTGQTWLTGEMIDAYQELYRLGHAHSVEAWCDGRLAGGVYGIAIGGLFAAESMYYEVRDASKVALVHLVAHLQARGYRLIDIQQLTDHTERLGAVEIPRSEYLRQLTAAMQHPATFGDRLEGTVP